jgi:hypothetical protein
LKVSVARGAKASGISTRDEATTGPIRPDYIFDDITALAAFLASRPS